MPVWKARFGTIACRFPRLVSAKLKITLPAYSEIGSRFLLNLLILRYRYRFAFVLFTYLLLKDHFQVVYQGANFFFIQL